jgi:hypothetical protein
MIPWERDYAGCGCTQSIISWLRTRKSKPTQKFAIDALLNGMLRLTWHKRLKRKVLPVHVWIWRCMNWKKHEKRQLRESSLKDRSLIICLPMCSRCSICMTKTYIREDDRKWRTCLPTSLLPVVTWKATFFLHGSCRHNVNKPFKSEYDGENPKMWWIYTQLLLSF